MEGQGHIGTFLVCIKPGVSISPGLDSVPGRDTPDRQTDRIPVANTRSLQYLPVQLSRVKMKKNMKNVGKIKKNIKKV